MKKETKEIILEGRDVPGIYFLLNPYQISVFPGGGVVGNSANNIEEYVPFERVMLKEGIDILVAISKKTNKIAIYDKAICY